jgi:LPXTG-motif cell wall-anchored protein
MRRPLMAIYNCTDSTSNAYGAGSYDTCTGQSAVTSNTGVFEHLSPGGMFPLAAALVGAIILAVIAWLVFRRRKKGQ